MATGERANNSSDSSGSSSEGGTGAGPRGLIQVDKRLAGARQIGEKNWFGKQMRKKMRRNTDSRIFSYRFFFFAFLFLFLR